MKLSLNHLSLLNYLSSPIVLAVPIALVVILFLPDTFSRYELIQTSSGRSDKANSIEKYYDLNNDGYDERVIAFPNALNKPAIKVLTNEGNNYEQWNFAGALPFRNNYFSCFDLNNDGYAEIYTYTVNSDSLFLNAIQPFPDKEILFTKKLIAILSKYEQTTDIQVNWEQAIDLDHDDHKELVFGLKAGYSKQPRGICIYNTVTKSIKSTSSIGASIGNIIITDLNKDNEYEIYCSCSTLGNIHDSTGIPYNDYSSWIMGFDKELNFLFPPIEYEVYPSFAKMTTISGANNDYIVASFKNTGGTDDPSRIIILNDKGKILHEKQYPKNLHTIFPLVIEGFSGQNYFLASAGTPGQLKMDSNFRILDSDPNVDYGHIQFIDDIDLDGEDEIILTGGAGNYIITRSNLKSPVQTNVEFNHFDKMPFYASIKHNGKMHPEIFIKKGNKVYFFEYHTNNLYYLKYPLWLGIYLLIFALIYFIRLIQQAQLKRRIEIESQINSLQLKTIKSQMDPHFTFNALTGISTHIKSGNSDIAYDYTMKFSRLLRSLYNNTDLLAISLADEVEFVSNYLAVEKLRFGKELDFRIEFDKNSLAAVKIPRMFIQLFVENAIKHGIRPKEGKGSIHVRLVKENNVTEITIEDNGIGRTKSRQIGTNSGKGLKIIDEMITLYKKTSGRVISYKYIDLFDKNGIPTGTRVIIKI